MKIVTELYNQEGMYGRRKQLRANLPRAEILLWLKIKNRQIEAVRFRRQFSIGGYVLDFYAPLLRLGIEVDGPSHFTDEGRENDKIRTAYLENAGIKLIRFLNEQVYNDMDEVLERLRYEVRNCPLL